MGKAMFTIIAAMAELERSVIRERVMAGLEYARIMAAVAEFEWEVVRERVASGLQRYRQDLEAGKVGRSVHSRSGKDQAVGRPMKIFDSEKARRLALMSQAQGWRTGSAGSQSPFSLDVLFYRNCAPRGRRGQWASVVLASADCSLRSRLGRITPRTGRGP
jgi:hypothetical protein